MNRTEEYLTLQAQLEQVPLDLDGTLARAEGRLLRRKRRITRLCSTMAASFALFVALVNFCMPVAYACSQVPMLRELAEAVTFSRSLTRAVDNQYVQPIDLTDTQNGITATVEYLIVDQKQVNVFFRLESEEHAQLDGEVDFTRANGDRFTGGMSWDVNDREVPTGQLQSATLELFRDDVPGQLQFSLEVYDSSQPPEPVSPASPVPPDQYLISDHPEYEQEMLAQFQFLLNFDPTFIRQCRVYPVEQEVVIEGQKLTIHRVEVYPTHLRIVTENDPANTTRLQGLRFKIEGDWGVDLERGSNGLVSQGLGDEMTYYFESPWFLRSERLTLFITSAELADKSRERICVDLTTGETDKPLPDGVSFHSASHSDGGWVVTFRGPLREKGYAYQMFGWDYYDAAGNSYTVNGMTSGGAAGVTMEDYEHWQFETLGLKDYHDGKVWLSPIATGLWYAEQPIEIPVK